MLIEMLLTMYKLFTILSFDISESLIVDIPSKQHKLFVSCWLAVHSLP